MRVISSNAVATPSSRVDSEVPLHVAGIHKAPATDGAGEWLFSGVKALVALQPMLMGEALGAVAAAIWLLARVHALVQLQVV